MSRASTISPPSSVSTLVSFFDRSSWLFRWFKSKFEFLSFFEPFTILLIIFWSSSESSLSSITMISKLLSMRPSRSLFFLDTSFFSAQVAFKTLMTSSIRSRSLCSSSARFYFFLSILVSASSKIRRLSSSWVLVRSLSCTSWTVFRSTSQFGGILSSIAMRSRSMSSRLVSLIFKRLSSWGIFVFHSLYNVSCSWRM